MGSDYGLLGKLGAYSCGVGDSKASNSAKRSMQKNFIASCVPVGFSGCGDSHWAPPVCVLVNFLCHFSACQGWWWCLAPNPRGRVYVIWSTRRAPQGWDPAFGGSDLGRLDRRPPDLIAGILTFCTFLGFPGSAWFIFPSGI